MIDLALPQPGDEALAALDDADVAAWIVYRRAKASAYKDYYAAVDKIEEKYKSCAK